MRRPTQETTAPGQRPAPGLRTRRPEVEDAPVPGAGRGPLLESLPVDHEATADHEHAEAGGDDRPRASEPKPGTAL
jgi:hypothetical protein